MALNDYRSVQDVYCGKMGPCLTKGHPKEHVLEAKCLNAMSNFFYDNGKFGTTFKDFLDAIKRK